MKNQKTIGYAYATSETASKFGCGKTGCYYVSVIGAMGTVIASTGFDKKQAALNYADSMNEIEWEFANSRGDFVQGIYAK